MSKEEQKNNGNYIYNIIKNVLLSIIIPIQKSTKIIQKIKKILF